MFTNEWGLTQAQQIEFDSLFCSDDTFDYEYFGERPVGCLLCSAPTPGEETFCSKACTDDYYDERMWQAQSDLGLV